MAGSSAAVVVAAPDPEISRLFRERRTPCRSNEMLPLKRETSAHLIPYIAKYYHWLVYWLEPDQSVRTQLREGLRGVSLDTLCRRVLSA
jgi:hypothetical protein